MTALDAAIRRVRRIGEPHGPHDHDAYAALMGRFLSGAAAMCRTEGFAVSSPMFSAATLIGGIDPLAESIPLIEDATAGIVGTYRRVACINHLLWCAARDREVAVALRHPAVFDPLVELVERGATLTIHKGDLVIEGGAYPMAGWLQRY